MQPIIPAFRRLLLFLILGLFLTGCAGDGLPAQAFAMSTPYSSAPSPAVISRPVQPTATAQVFQLRPTSTPLPTSTPFSANLDLSFGSGPDFNPLTGLKVPDQGLLERRPMAIKVTNFPRSVRPQWGLSLADNVYEYYIGDQMTRFIAVYYGTDAERVGPVRSGRYFDENVVRMYKAIFVFGYADDRVVDPWMESDLRNFLVVERHDNCPPLCRIGPKSNYNTLYANTQQLTEYINARGTNNARQDLSGLHFEALAPFSFQAGKALSIRYTYISYHRWEYDPSSGRYLRFQESQDEVQGEQAYLPLSDSQDGAQLAADNVVILLIPHVYVINTRTTEMVTMNFMGQGGALVFRDGQAYQVNWQRAGEATLLSLVYPDGRPFPLKPGRTWFEVIGDSSGVEQGPDGNWGFVFKIP